MILPVQKIEKILQERLQPTFLEVQDESAKHAGHAGARQGSGGHFLVTVVTELFVGKSLIEQHRMVNEALRDLFGSQMHALALQTFSPEQWKARAK